MLASGSTVHGRFVIDREIGHGGMGTLYRAADRQTDDLVAVKVLGRTTPADQERFAREARALCALDHPGIVRYVTEGATDEGQRYLVMEWLEGEDLGRRLTRGPLAIDESVEVVSRVAGALGYAHARGLVHRDVKPSNVFIPDGRLDRVKLLDFGLVRFLGASERATGTGMLVGTPGYLAPEQARSSREIDARADVFAIGCVLFECLTGRPAFEGESVLAVLSRIVFGEATRASALRPEIPAGLDDLVARMLTKDPQGRPVDGHDVVRALRGLQDEPEALARPSLPESSSGARRLLCVVLARPAEEPVGGDTVQMLVEDLEGPWETVRGVVVSHDGRMERLADGSVVALVRGAGAATDQAARGGRMALAMRDALKGWRLAVATGLGDELEGPPVGEVVDRAARLLSAPGVVAIDPLTAGLLEARFEVLGSEPRLELGLERTSPASRRVLLGRATPCVGRERERALLRGLFEQCAAEWIPRVALVTGPAGAGKSRLRHEVVREIGDGAWVVLGQGDDLRAGAPFGMLVPALRAALALHDHPGIEPARDELRASVSRLVPAEDVARVSELLGELVGVRFSDEHSPLLRLARHDVDVMGTQTLRAFEDLLRGASATRPVLVALDDLQWGDAPTVRFVDAALRLAGRPILVLAFARPEVRDVFPDVWATHDVQAIDLPALSARASERLVHAVLGADVPPDRVRRIVDQASGNAFFLEELIRGEAQGARDSMPDTVLAMIHARLSALPGESLEAVCRASVLGRTFFRSSLRAVCPDGPAGALDRTVDDLVERELIHRRAASSRPADLELAFRHDLVREAAYSMLHDDEREAAHRAAAECLESNGGADPAVLARHLERAGLHSRAADAYLAAARQSLRGDDLEAAIDLAERGVRCGASGGRLASLRLVQGEALEWRGRLVEAERALAEAWTRMDPGSPDWPDVLIWLACASMRVGRVEQVIRVAADLGKVLPSSHRRVEIVRASCSVLTGLVHAGRADLADPIVSRLEEAVAAGPPDPAVGLEMEHLRGWRALQRGEAADFIQVAGRVIDFHEGAGDTRMAIRTRVNLGFALTQAGLHERAAALLRASHEHAARTGLAHYEGSSLQNLGLALCRLGELDDARTVLRRSIAVFERIGDEGYAGTSWAYLAMAEARGDALEAAESAARTALDLLHDFPPAVASTRAILARILLRRGAEAEALVLARQAFAVLENGDDVDEGRPTIQIAMIECLEAAGDREAADRETRAAHAWLASQAARLDDPELRTKLLTSIPEHQEILDRARRLGL